MAGVCKHENKLLRSIKGREFFDQLSDNRLFKEDLYCGIIQFVSQSVSQSVSQLRRGLKLEAERHPRCTC
jgi:hypothetical protein